jgi:predicted TIM-barrel fold metal-dependent hydrolase
MRVDVHQHLWPPELVAALRARTGLPRLEGSHLHTVEGSFRFDTRWHDPERRLAALDRDGVDVAVLSLQPSLGLESLAESEREELEQCWLDGIAAVVEGAGGRFTALAPGRVDGSLPGTSVGASTLLHHGEHADLLDRLERGGGYLFVHPEATGPQPPGMPDWWGWTAGYTAQMQAAYLAWLAGGRERWPRLRVVFAILAGGAAFHLERLAHRGVEVRSSLEPNVYLDVATYGRRAIELCIETFGVGQLVYGSDRPVVDPRLTLRAVRGFGDAVARLLQIETPGALLQ